MAKYLTHRQKAFCRHFLKLNDAYDAAIKAGYKHSTAKQLSFKWVEDPYFKKYMEILQKQPNYSFDAYIMELDKAMELAFKANNPAVMIKIIEAKGKAFGFNNLSITDITSNANNVIKKDLFEKIQEKADVFEKFKQGSPKGDISGDNT